MHGTNETQTRLLSLNITIEIMVVHAIVHYPEINTEKIESFRKKYDPTYKLIRAHLTITFGVDQLVSEQSFSDHVRAVLKHWKPFDIELNGFAKSWDHWLFLILKKGNDKVIRLHDELYGGIFAPYLRTDIQYIPHIGLGEFIEKGEVDLLKRKRLRLKKPAKIALDEVRYKIALEETRNLGLSYSTKLDKLQMIEIDDGYTIVEDIEVFPLSSN